MPNPFVNSLVNISIQNIWASIQNIWGAPPLEYFTILLSHNDTNKYYGITPQLHSSTTCLTPSPYRSKRRSTGQLLLASTPAKESQLKVVLQDAIPNGRQNPLDLAEDTLDGGARCLTRRQRRSFDP